MNRQPDAFGKTKESCLGSTHREVDVMKVYHALAAVVLNVGHVMGDKVQVEEHHAAKRE